jgi:hypothetical protein
MKQEKKGGGNRGWKTKADRDPVWLADRIIQDIFNINNSHRDSPVRHTETNCGRFVSRAATTPYVKEGRRTMASTCRRWAVIRHTALVSAWMTRATTPGKHFTQESRIRSHTWCLESVSITVSRDVHFAETSGRRLLKLIEHIQRRTPITRCL